MTQNALAGAYFSEENSVNTFSILKIGTSESVLRDISARSYWLLICSNGTSNESLEKVSILEKHMSICLGPLSSCEAFSSSR